MKQFRLTTIVFAAFLAGISSVAQADITVSKNDNYKLSIYQLCETGRDLPER